MEALTKSLSNVAINNTTQKQSKKNLTTYWGVELQNDAFDHPEIKERLDKSPNLVKLKKIHSTLLYVGKQINADEDKLKPFENCKCKLIVDAFGHSELACALRIKSVTCCEEDNTDNIKTVPFFERQQHVTMALEAKVSPRDSVETLLGSGEIVELKNEFVIYGTVKRYV